ncbi:type IA DNA topoisomerase [Porphyromonas gingivalis]|uniref:type IA DNA topoisomerase n=1 Tax=Porphyromonas gingivalis TaxID=837 RepID=UPI000C1790E3|nr:type IA DNA topoisomerase [Porphyromonas gingivalis]ATS01438.1 DNA topoisomerase III [Porphyromonas gingivalis]
MKLIIAEKPSVARDIAAIVGADNRKEGYLEGGGYAVTWAFGHLVGLAMPADYGITGFQAEKLPILPAAFKLIPRQIKEGKEYKPDPGVLKQLKIIGELFDKCERIVVATDAGREGELIFRYLYAYLNGDKPFDRLWISSLTDQAIRNGLNNLRPGTQYDNLYLSAKARSQADWLVGINASQALSISAGSGVWSLGRVQTPTLAMICSRYLENKEFKPQTYFQIRLHTAKESISFPAISTDRYDSRQDADKILARIRSAEYVSVSHVEKKQVSQEPPLLYDLTTLQKEANNRHGFSADKTLSIAQSLYEAKFISYLRTGSRYISDDVFADIPALIAQLSADPLFGSYAQALSSGTELNRRSVNDKKVTDHHALIITENMPQDLSSEQKTLYDMIVARVLEAFSGKCTQETTTVSLEIAGVPFSVKGSVVLIPGWRGMLNAQDEEREDDAISTLPDLSPGERLPVNDGELLEKQTRPRPVHTESSLLSAMETCGKELTDETEREALKELGIGTPATRAGIIETLLSREYIRREKKSLVPTNKGLTVYLAVRDKKIADVSMTGEWERALNKIAAGEMDADTFHKGIEVYASQITSELLESRIESGHTREAYPCPKCKNGRVVLFPKVAKCNNEACGLTVFRNKSGKDLTDGQLKELLLKRKTPLIKGFKSKENKSFDAAIAFDTAYNMIFQFNNAKRKKK